MSKKLIKDKKMYDKVVSMCENIDMPFYQRVLLVSMVYRKVMHPREKISEIIDKVTDKGNLVSKIYKEEKQKTCMKISAKREFQYLEEFLHECKNIPEDLLNGNVVENVVKYFAQKAIFDEN